MKPWLEIAKSKIGQHEQINGENPFIIECLATTTYPSKQDETPWCSAFVNWCLKKVGIKGTNSAAAKSWLDWGAAIDTPEEGCITVIQQKQATKDKSTGSASGFHVAFWLKQDANYVTLLGGNQHDTVRESDFPLSKYSIKGYRMPKGVL